MNNLKTKLLCISLVQQKWKKQDKTKKTKNPQQQQENQQKTNSKTQRNTKAKNPTLHSQVLT